MSIEAINWVIHNREITDRTEFCILFAMANRAQPEGNVTMGIERWARESRCSRATLQRAIPRLVEAGWITRDERPGRASEYRMLFPAYGTLPLIPDHHDQLPSPYYPPHHEAGGYPQPASPGDAGARLFGASPGDAGTNDHPPHHEAGVPHQVTRHPRHPDEARTHSDPSLHTAAFGPQVVDTRIPEAQRALGLQRVEEMRAQLQGRAAMRSVLLRERVRDG